MRRPTNLRLALVIGKAAHAAAPLLNLSNDAKAISAAAHGLHNHRSAQGAGATGTRAGGAALKGRHGVGLLYHAGHGLQLHGRNDSVPVDAQLTSAADVPAQTLPLPPRATRGPRGAWRASWAPVGARRLRRNRRRLLIQRPHLQCAHRLASRCRSVGSARAPRKPHLTPRPLPHAGEGAMPGPLSRARERVGVRVFA